MKRFIEFWIILRTYLFTECVPIFFLASLGGIPIGIMSSAIGLKICVITAEIKKYKLTNIKKKKMHDEILH